MQSARPKERPPGRERQLRRHGSRPREGGQAAATLEDYAPVRKAQAPVWGLRSSGRAPSRQRGLPAGVMFYVGAGPPRVRAPSSRAPVSTTAQKAQLIGCRVRRGCRVFGDRGARRPRDVRRPREAARWAAGSASPTYPAPRAMPQRKGRFSRTASRRARLQYQAVQKRAPGGARCVHSGAHRRR